jgi:hypothetical protein
MYEPICLVGSRKKTGQKQTKEKKRCEKGIGLNKGAQWSVEGSASHCTLRLSSAKANILTFPS